MGSALFCLALLLAPAVVLHRRSAGKALSRPPEFADVAACCAGSFFYAFFLLFSDRPAFALGSAALLLGVLWLVNAAKMQALRGEPLVFTDLALTREVVLFPHLYLPFLPCKMFALGLVAGGAFLAALWQLSPLCALPKTCVLVLAAPLLFFLLLRSRWGGDLEEALLEKFPLSFDPRADAQRYGPLGAALLHAGWHLSLRGRRGVGILHATAVPVCAPPWPAEAFALETEPAQLPDIFLVQAESFCDPREFSSLIPKDILPHFDAIRAAGLAGKLAAASYGASTLRTEFAVLTGQSPRALGTDAFYPYLSVSRYPTWSMAHYLRGLGYRTVCLHPFEGRFFFRHKTMPHLGFDQFISLENFPHQEKYGPYVSDKSVAQSMLELLGEGAPVFCFAITMESHGPWRRGRLGCEEEAGGLARLPGLSPQVNRYLAHLRHADDMIGLLRDGLRQRRRAAVLGWYGDHLPNLPMLVPEGEIATPCFIWGTKAGCDAAPAPDRDSGPKGLIAPERFAGLLLSCAARLTPKDAHGSPRT